ncbi:hypothetical protein SKAU_G00104490 [Synaphobranchus kaupii]|uniref:Uncharacterized protein n=1 Tax=Synaphobranchus kaupii TaxID=118154 RepID=A0A9Q1FZ82_SYNKA|nr:hypothetical protein SKAU_G00104490 [Synaphobranchus kaupii]
MSPQLVLLSLGIAWGGRQGRRHQPISRASPPTTTKSPPSQAPGQCLGSVPTVTSYVLLCFSDWSAPRRESVPDQPRKLGGL